MRVPRRLQLGEDEDGSVLDASDPVQQAIIGEFGLPRCTLAHFGPVPRCQGLLNLYLAGPADPDVEDANPCLYIAYIVQALESLYSPS
eukprot:scaffold1932_cov162-Isochrysis_galbana.AAC.4